MAQRPFGTHYVHFSKSTSGNPANSPRNFQQQENSSNNSSQQGSKPRLKWAGNSSGGPLLTVRYNSANEDITGINSPLLLQNHRDSNFCVQPLAIEPCANERASVATVLVQMPQNQTLNFGCVLVPSHTTTNSSHPQIHNLHSS